MMPRPEVQINWEQKDAEWREKWAEELKRNDEAFARAALLEKSDHDTEQDVQYKIFLKQRNAFIKEIDTIFTEIKEHNYLGLLQADLDHYQTTLVQQLYTPLSPSKTPYHVMMSARKLQNLNTVANPEDHFNAETFWEKHAEFGYISTNSNLQPRTKAAAEVISKQVILYGICIAAAALLMALTAGIPPVGILLGLSAALWVGANISSEGKMFKAEQYSPTIESTKMGRKVHAMFKTPKEIPVDNEIKSVKDLDRREYKQNP